MKIKQI